VWSLALVPFAVAGLPVDADVSFTVGLALSLLANAATVLALAYAGRAIMGRRSAGLLAGGVFAAWPLLTRPLAGASAWENGTWHVDTGLHLYTEPLSTAAIAAMLALLLVRPTPLRAALAGGAAGLAVATRPSNVLLLGVAAAFLVAWRRRDALPFVAAAAAVAPPVLAYLEKGYGLGVSLEPPAGPDGTVGPTLSPGYVVPSWADSLLFSPLLLALLLSVAILGAVGLPGRVAALLVSGALVSPIVYSFFWATAEHPRFLYASLPPLLLLWGAGVALTSRLASPAAREHEQPGGEVRDEVHRVEDEGVGERYGRVHVERDQRDDHGSLEDA
jgi:hypothetical protein